MLGARTATCPNCGGPIEFGLGSSTALVCPHCRFSVVRTDRDLRALGRVADLVPTAPPISVGDSGLARGRGFRVAGRMQLDHGAGPWDEWYLGFDDGTWGWLARAQGTWYLTQIASPDGIPPAHVIAPGQQLVLGGTGSVGWVVQELGHSTVLSAEGELPFPVVPGAVGRFADLSGPNGAFATIDYGDGSEPPSLFAGAELAPDALELAKTAGGPRPEEKLKARKLSCPTCGAPVDISSSRTESAACQYCFSLLYVEDEQLSFHLKLEQRKIELPIPLGSEGMLFGQRTKVIGVMERYTVSYGETYAWREYLLYCADGTYRWLMEDSGHWLFITPVRGGDVQSWDSGVRYGGRTHKRFSANAATVRFVLGEFYWRVEMGERTAVADYIDPPYIVSSESTGSELIWSAGEYVDAKVLYDAFRIPGKPRRPSGVAPAQPNPHRVVPAVMAFLALVAVFVGIGVTMDWGRRHPILVSGPLALPPTPGPPPINTLEDRASYTPPFTVTADRTTLEIDLTTSADNDYVGVACALVNEDTGEVREFYVDAEYNHGVTGGESWSEGSRDGTVYVDRIRQGRYSLRLEPQWSHWNGPGTILSFASVPTPPTASIRIRQGGRSPVTPLLVFLLLAAPFGLLVFRHHAFEKKRWENSSFNVG